MLRDSRDDHLEAQFASFYAIFAVKCPKKQEKTPFALVDKRRFFVGGGEGNRTPVRKSIHKNFSGCRPSFTFPRKDAEGQAYFQGISLIQAAVREQLPPLVHR